MFDERIEFERKVFDGVKGSDLEKKERDSVKPVRQRGAVSDQE